MKNYRLTLIGFAVSVVVLVITIITDLDLFEILVSIIKRFEANEIDEYIISIIIFAFFVFYNLIKRQRSLKIEVEKIKIYKAMMSSTHHILNNFLNQVQIFKMTAEETPGFDPEVLVLYDQIIESASAQIDALGNISNINEASIRKSVAPQPDTKTKVQQVATGDTDKPLYRT